MPREETRCLQLGRARELSETHVLTTRHGHLLFRLLSPAPHPHLPKPVNTHCPSALTWVWRSCHGFPQPHCAASLFLLSAVDWNSPMACSVSPPPGRELYEQGRCSGSASSACNCQGAGSCWRTECPVLGEAHAESGSTEGA